MRIVDYTRADYGVDLGGFLVKDRLWFFAAYDRVSDPAQISRYVVDRRLVPDTIEFPARHDRQPLLGQADLEPRGEHDARRHASSPTRPRTRGESRRPPRWAVSRSRNPDPGTWESTRTIGGTDFGLRSQCSSSGPRASLTLQAARHQDKYDLVPTGPGMQVRTEDWTCEGGTPEEPCDVPGGAELRRRGTRHDLRPDQPQQVAPGPDSGGCRPSTGQPRAQGRRRLSGRTHRTR